MPIAPDKATERAQMILEDAMPVAVLTNEHYMTTIQGLTKAKTMAVESLDSSLSTCNLTNVSRTSSDMAYMVCDLAATRGYIFLDSF